MDIEIDNEIPKIARLGSSEFHLLTKLIEDHFSKDVMEIDEGEIIDIGFSLDYGTIKIIPVGNETYRALVYYTYL